ncbi:hypothetical protein [Roseateles sp.]|uniref:hypothetical protein n=1 Tax=Roseateles sp. TaxID=1971397 RepID=UPI00286B7A0A|nr:hypothetical protein [Roseateles sp.]
MNHHSPLYQWLCSHRLLCFLLLTAGFIGFGVLSLDLVRLVSANAGFLLTHGWAGLMEGGLMQLLELAGKALAAMVCYMVFKLCEHALLDRLAHSGVRRRPDSNAASKPV